MASHEVLFNCWVCRGRFQHVDGISLIDDHFSKLKVSQVCSQCWKRIPSAQRIMIMRCIKTKQEGGLGLAELVERVMVSFESLDKLSKAGEEWKTPGPKEMGEFTEPPEDDDEEFRKLFEGE